MYSDHLCLVWLLICLGLNLSSWLFVFVLLGFDHLSLFLPLFVLITFDLFSVLCCLIIPPCFFLSVFVVLLGFVVFLSNG